MPLRRARRRRRRAHPVRRAPGAVIFLVLSVAVAALTGALLHKQRVEAERYADARMTAAVAAARARLTERPVYPYSVIPGGAHSPDELRTAIGSDAVVRAHYERFDLAHTRVVRAATDRLAHVSYRRGSQVFWTSKKVRIPAGELLLTDGSRWARTRCGNQIADVPGPTSILEPTSAELDTPAGSLPPPTIAGFGLRTLADGVPGPGGPRSGPPADPGTPGARPPSPGPQQGTLGQPPTTSPHAVDPGAAADPGTSVDPGERGGPREPPGEPLTPPQYDPGSPAEGRTGDPNRLGHPGGPPASPAAPPSAGGPPPFGVPPVVISRIIVDPTDLPGEGEGGSGSVPEPATLSLAASAVALALIRRRRERLRGTGPHRSDQRRTF